MIPIDIKEEKHYFYSDLHSKFKCNRDKLDTILNRLNRKNIIKFGIKNSQEYVKFIFVGVLIIDNYVINCYPKYVKEYVFEDLKQIIKVFERLNKDEEIIDIRNTSEGNEPINMLPLMLFLLNDYFDNGLYSNFQEVVEINGDGEILWERTINNNKVIIQNNMPYYYEVFTRNRTNDLKDYFRRLHKIILADCSQKLKESNLLNLFDLTEVNLTDETLENFDDKDVILNNINYELHTQFNSRKLELLEAMKLYVCPNNLNFGLKGCFSLYGTTSFNNVWEKVCCYVFNDLKDTPLSNIPLPCELDERYIDKTDLMSLIERPSWNILNYEPDYRETLKPDLITINEVDNVFTFYIFDAKYYDIIDKRNCKIKNPPGIGDISKQYLYQLAFEKFIDDHHFDRTINCFLFPSSSSIVRKIGCAEFSILKEEGLENIQILLLPPKEVYKSFLEHDNEDLVNQAFSILDSSSYESECGK